jgi:hypothetical protein
MMALRKFVTTLLVLALLFVEACNKNKPVLPSRSLAPTIAVALPDEIPESPETSVPEIATVPVEPPQVKTKPKKTSRVAVKKTAPPPATASVPPPPPANNNQAQTVASLHSPQPPDTAIAAVMRSDEVTKQKEDTAQIVDATENNLKNLSRQLSEEEKSMRAQIQSYLQQSRKATSDGDFERAFNLAKKAQLLADALIKK